MSGGGEWWQCPCPLESVPRVRVCDPKLLDFIREQRPIVITDSKLVESARHWDLEYMEKHMGDCKFTVYESKERVFMFSDEEKNLGNYKFTPTATKRSMTFQEFASEFREAMKSKDKFLYLQQGLNDTVGPTIVKDFVGFNWTWLTDVVKALNWGHLTTNMLFVSMPHLVTPCHYDEQENFFAQVRGTKRVILFHPDNFRCLYPYRYGHPCDRQSQVDFDNPDYERFPKFKDARGLEAILRPGDVLYIPRCWWHLVRSLDELSVSVNFWYMSPPAIAEDIRFPLTASQKVAMMRNIEQMLLTALGSAGEVSDFLRMLVSGRYDTDANHTFRQLEM
ncbi:hypothetical protein PTSG_00189 [Salpingoeca rosetta]|uniref:JmjC domain-containing protein n=1 Tax=Salpingoeca rosetta (strain ATCC 50818 / BSB-021) TaxID=946362 RepID=F2TVS1_SALR5|nr:uncharacterized protein PTSG_00189 [Salpingoeca rosetta]EGD72167.1 hypothetical protein PTSG_00189 [Salpingoeca rosetta]|eukprot:XP_004998739.1 hypothetical protein PTSG_00189 [Salpingoeca rosetta]